MNYKVLIASAGIGNRLEGMTKNINKALVSVAHKPVISYIIDKIPIEIEIVIAIGYKGDILKNFINMNYPERKVTFVEVDNYIGKGSGLGYSILKCKDELQCPFIFTSNDTIVLEDFPVPDHNWLGQTNSDKSGHYRTISSKDGIVNKINSKGECIYCNTYIGLAGIFDYECFWESMIFGMNQGAIEIGESYALRDLIDKDLKTRDFTWFDTGNITKLNETRRFFNNNSYNILEKEEEAIWFSQDKVIKFSVDEDFIKNRVIRSTLLEGFVPQVISYSKNMYAYKKIDGEIFSKNPNLEKFQSFLNWMNSFWIKPKILNTQKIEELCYEFYHQKTYKRIKEYFIKTESKDENDIINGVESKEIYELLKLVNWNEIYKGISVRFHGDLHFENILVSNSKFTLLDWRQDFGGELFYGDIYYDFAKLNHGLIVSHEMVDKNNFNVNIKGREINFSFERDERLIDCEAYFYSWLEANGYNVQKVKILTALVFLNIATLHHKPYDKFLFYLGKSMLNKTLN